MKIFLTGGTGLLGLELRRSLSRLGNVVAPTSAELDLRVEDDVRRMVHALRPDLVVNAAAYTDVDAAESDREAAFGMNRDLPDILAEECAAGGALLLHFSTDYVFDGKKSGAYEEGDVAGPVNAYGASKLAGEQAVAARSCRHVIVRTSWLYGESGKNFLLTMLDLLQAREEVRVVDDQYGAPTWSRLVAEATRHIVAHASHQPEVRELFHLSCSGSCSWFEFAGAIASHLEAQGRSVARLLPVSADDYARPSRRPANSRLSCARLQEKTGLALPDWRQALKQCLEEGAFGRHLGGTPEAS